MRIFFILCLIAFTSVIFAVTNDSGYLYGIHWYGNTDSISPGQTTDVETMTGSKGIWVLDITLLDSAKTNAWDQPWQTSPLDKTQPGYRTFHAQKICQGKGHSLIYRLQPNWSRNVPHISDPYTLTNYADDCKAAANVLKDWCHIWQIGNEVNLGGENMRWGGADYNTQWEPTPEQYAETYIACRDKIHEITPNTSPATQIVLMQPSSPGSIETSVGRFMDANEFLWRQIEAISDKSKIDGFALHSYAEPGASDYGVGGFWDSIREQLMIIDQLGLGDRPVFIAEWNKHMPNATEAKIGAKFLWRGYELMNNWNTSTDGEWLGFTNHKIVTATWFVYPDDSWTDYSLKYWKTLLTPSDQENNPWYSFNYSCGFNYPKGAVGGGPTVPQSSFWWRDDFDGAALDSTPPLPDWKAEATGSQTAAQAVVMSGTGSVRLLGNSLSEGGGSIRTIGYVYNNFRLEADVTITNAARSNTAVPEANFDVRIREGYYGYSLTFFTSGSPNNPNRIILRRTNNWGEYLSNYLVSDGINSGDSFQISITANGSNITYRVYKNGGTTPIVNWNISDSGQKIGWIRLMSYNLNEARVNDFRLGGPQWNGVMTNVSDWNRYY